MLPLFLLKEMIIEFIFGIDEVLNLLNKADLTEKVKYYKVKNFLNVYKNG